jgi:TolB-like protein
MRSRAQAGVVLAAALVAGVLVPGAAEAQRIAPLPKPCHVEGTELLHLPQRIPGSLAISIFASDSTDADGELAGGIADAVANRIGSAIPRILVIGRRAQRRLVVVDSLTARAMADSLGATYVLAGRVSEGIRGRTVGFTLYNGVTGRALYIATLAPRLRPRGAVGRGVGAVASTSEAQTAESAPSTAADVNAKAFAWPFAGRRAT